MNQQEIKDFLALPYIISVEKGITMKETYKNDIQNIIEKNRDNGTYQATELAWIDLETLKKYVQVLEEVSAQNGTPVSGLRIYFSEYPKDGNYTPEQKERLLPGRETIFFAPTIKVEPTDLSKKYPILEHKPFCILPDGDNPIKGILKVITDLEVSVEKNGNTENLINETSLLLNDFHLIPPPKE